MKATPLILCVFMLALLAPVVGVDVPAVHLLLAGSRPYAAAVEVGDGANCKLHFLVEDPSAGDCTIQGALLQAGGPLAVSLPETVVNTERIVVGDGVAVFRINAQLPRRGRDVTFVLQLDVERNGKRLSRQVIRLNAKAAPPADGSKTSEPNTP